MVVLLGTKNLQRSVFNVYQILHVMLVRYNPDSEKLPVSRISHFLASENYIFGR